MMVYSVMLEGRDDGRGFLVTIDVAGSSGGQAKELAVEEASKRGLQIVGVEEVARRGKSEESAYPQVLKVYGKAYFDLGATD